MTMYVCVGHLQLCDLVCVHCGRNPTNRPLPSTTGGVTDLTGPRTLHVTVDSDLTDPGPAGGVYRPAY